MSAPVEIRRSPRRQRTVTAFWENGTIVVAVPAGGTQTQEQEWVRKALHRLNRRVAGANDHRLLERARQLSARFLEGKAQPVSVRWVTNQQKRWGSTSPSSGAIRLSSRLRAMPDWVVDYVLHHELAHLLVADHGPDFRQLMARYPRSSEAEAFLAGVVFGQHHRVEGTED